MTRSCDGDSLGRRWTRKKRVKSTCRRSEFSRAGFARAYLTKVLKAVNPRGMTIGKHHLHSIIPHRRRRLGRNSRLVHRQYGAASHFGFFFAFIPAKSARAMIAQVGKVIPAFVTVRPNHRHALPSRYVHFYAGGFLPFIRGYRHCDFILTDESSYFEGQHAPAGIGFP